MVTVEPFAAGETMLILGGMQLLYTIVIVSVSVPQEFVVERRNVFVPGVKTTEFWKAPVVVLKVKLVSARPFCVIEIPCLLAIF